MGPRAEARGKHDVTDRRGLARGLQWGRAPKRAESPTTPGPTPPNPPGFNGAARRSARKVADAQQHPDAGEASMGPRAEARGKRRRGLERLREQVASMGPRAEARGKRYRVCTPCLTSQRFNGAARRSARKGPRPTCRPPSLATLQWGRAPKRAESGDNSACSRKAILASMGPRAEARGKIEPDDPVLAGRRFNGAARRSARKGHVRDHDRILAPRFNGAARRSARKAISSVWWR